MSVFIGMFFVLVWLNIVGVWLCWFSENSMCEFENRNEFIIDMNDMNSMIFIVMVVFVKFVMLNSDMYGDFRLVLLVYGMYRIRIDIELM